MPVTLRLVGVVGGVRSRAAEAGDALSARASTSTIAVTAIHLAVFVLVILFTPFLKPKQIWLIAPCYHNIRRTHSNGFLLRDSWHMKKLCLQLRIYSPHSLEWGLYSIYIFLAWRVRDNPGFAHYPYGIIVNASMRTVVEPFGLVTRTSQVWVPNEESALTLTVALMVV